MTKKRYIYQSDALATVYVHTLNDGTCIFRAQGKRVSKDCPLSVAERRVYVNANGRSVALVKYVKDTRNLSLSEAWALCKAAIQRKTYYNTNTGAIHRVFDYT